MSLSILLAALAATLAAAAPIPKDEPPTAVLGVRNPTKDKEKDRVLLKRQARFLKSERVLKAALLKPGVGAKVLMTGGMWHFDLKASEGGNDKVTVVDGNLEINNDADPGTDPILRVLMLGDEQGGEDYLIFSTVGGSIVGDFLAANKQFQNADFDTLIFTDPLLPGMGYQLTTALGEQPPGGGQG